MDNFYTFKFNTPQLYKHSLTGNLTLDYYYARTELFNLSLMADYELVCLATLTAIDKHWYQIETAKSP